MLRAPQAQPRLLSGSFARSFCPHAALFRSDYSRSNRNRGTKIIRCFPHCCPTHVDRSYCGSGLELRLELELCGAQVDQVLVFARFEPLLDKAQREEHGLGLAGRIEHASDAPGSLTEPQHSYAWLRSQSQGPENPTGEWTFGELSPDVDNQRSKADNDSTAATFLLNAEASARWFYHWESGANKIQRSMRHALRAFVFWMPTHSDSLELIGIVRSPVFTIVSHRRAPPSVNPSANNALASEQGASIDGHDDDGEADTNSISLRYPSERGKPFDSELHALVKRNISRAFRDFSTQAVSHDSTSQQSDEFPQRADRIHPSPVYPRREEMEGRDARALRKDWTPLTQSRREPRRSTPVDTFPSNFVEALRDLSVLHLFLSHVDLSETILESPALTERVRRISTQMWGVDWHLPDLLRLVCSSGSLCGDIPAYSNYNRPKSTESSAIDYTGFDSDLVDFEMLAPLLVEITIWALSTASRKSLSTHFARLAKQIQLEASDSFYDSSQHAFNSTAQIMWTQLSEFLATEGQQSAFFHLVQLSKDSSRVRALRNALMLIIVRDRRFRPLVPQLEAIFQWSSTSNHTDAYGWQSFIAQMREEYIRSRQPPSRFRPVSGVSTWDGSWRIVPDTVQVDHEALGECDQDWMTMWTVGTVLVQLARLEIRAEIGDTTQPTIRIRSHGGILNDDPGCWMALVCDGRPRIAGVLPDGRSTLSGALLGGDYAAYMTSGRHHDSLRFYLYWWPICPDVSGQSATRLEVDAVMMHNGDLLCLVFQVAKGTIRHSSGGPFDSMELWTVAQRMESVARWRTVGPTLRVSYSNSDYDASYLTGM